MTMGYAIQVNLSFDRTDAANREKLVRYRTVEKGVLKLIEQHHPIMPHNFDEFRHLDPNRTILYATRREEDARNYKSKILEKLAEDGSPVETIVSSIEILPMHLK